MYFLAQFQKQDLWLHELLRTVLDIVQKQTTAAVKLKPDRAIQRANKTIYTLLDL